MESPNEIAWENLVSSFFEMIDARSNYLLSEQAFRSGGGGFDSMKSNRIMYEKSRKNLKTKFDAYVFGSKQEEKCP